ncbi:hypothetical protein I4641_12595 [Waterburya agarophytonicola K14]|uniref:Uncharacterized protein n=1 Tax=Waterburya agarophytonicola KI4 TaxID=2874699 RepID=A0A964BS57_9CYAN|nr:hypothetical protein [Waterburya agarophytonicola]MCC0177817.1 hypothetical protein [Waterburya agarophytonicola KI4]
MIRYDLAALDIQDQGLEMKPIDGKWHMMRNGTKYYDAPTKEALIEAYYNHDMQDYTYPDNIKCECGNCHEEALYFECPGCLSTVGYCMGQDDYYYEFCTLCYWQLSQDLITVVIQEEKPDIYVN